VASNTAASAGSHTRRALWRRLLLRGKLKEGSLKVGHHDRLGSLAHHDRLGSLAHALSTTATDARRKRRPNPVRAEDAGFATGQMGLTVVAVCD
jgi:hypothetical protein